MRRDKLLVVLTATGSALWWWPVIMEPSLDLQCWLPIASFEICWLPLAFIALLTGSAAALSGGRWLRFLIASSFGTFVGLCAGFAIWYPTDPIAASFIGYIVIVQTLAAVFVSLVASLVGRKLSASNDKSRRAVWVAFICCVAFGPVVVALTPPLVSYRVARNDRLAAKRFDSLKDAVERTRAESGDPRRICDGLALKRNYSGPPFSERDWKYIAGNYVKEDGYILGISIYCPEPGNYTIDVRPEREKGDGTRRFCSDESGRAGCGFESSNSWSSCTPCTK